MVNRICGLTKYFKLMIKLLFKRVFVKKNIWFISTPIYDNIGDYAIVFAQYKLFEDINLKKYIIDLSRREYERLDKFINFFVKKNDLIIIDGGGNIGTIWPKEESRIRGIITRFKSNPIIIFPQTAFFDNSENGKNELLKSISIYNSHPDLTVFCRDLDTYNMFQKMFNNVSSHYTPDIVMYLDNVSLNGQNNNILFNIRTDREATLDSDLINTFKTIISSKGYRVVDSSTIMSGINKRNRFDLLKAKLQEYSESNLVITDRLHGMIFSAIVGTPCICFDNLSHKVKNCYNWISYLNYIHYCDNGNAFNDCLNEIECIINKRGKYNLEPNKEYFDIIKNIVKEKYYS